jgi:6,7-dimethyl-8-ribityllumazine synthase
VAREHRGQLIGSGRSFALVVGRTNEVITDRLRAGAIDCLERHGVDPDAIEVYWVPGAFEIPLIAERAAASRRFDAVIALGAVIRGGTSHYEQVVAEAARGVAHASRTTGVPVIYGVITAETLEQAVERAGAKSNRGFEAALSALEMANLVAGDRPAGRPARRRAREA